MTDIWPKIEMSGPDCIINSQMNCCLTSRTQWGCIKQWYKSWRGAFRCSASPIWRSSAVLAQLKKKGFLSKPLCSEIPWPSGGNLKRRRALYRNQSESGHHYYSSFSLCRCISSHQQQKLFYSDLKLFWKKLLGVVSHNEEDLLSHKQLGFLSKDSNVFQRL